MLKWNFSHDNNILKRNKEIENSSFILENELQNTLKDFHLIAAMGDKKMFLLPAKKEPYLIEGSLGNR